MIREARFIGESGSLGLKHGEVYLLSINVKNDYIVVEICTASEDRSEYIESCPYSSIIAFLKNWDEISKIKVEDK